ncbi:MAG: IS607 family transposase [Candidatus Subteraquimicrobiales bacterium]|nr:IS607 family transposase [Candidatus Subteraquimicrobiales bacterium]
MLYSIGKFATQIGVTVHTLRQWHKEGSLIPAKVTHGGTRYYSDAQIEGYLGISAEKGDNIVVYARVSNAGQREDLNNQVRFLREYCNAKGYIIDVVTDVGSGLNYKRKNWSALIDDAMSGRVNKIVIAHKDRFVRFGYEWIEGILTKAGCGIEVVKNDSLSPQEELVHDLISIIHVFSCRIYGLRKYKKELLNDKDITVIQG